MPVEISDARRIVFGGLIDYAGLFPPASLDMADAVAGYRAARSSEHSWMVERFIVGASRLEELAVELASSMQGGEEPWRLSVLADLGRWPAFDETHRAVAVFSDEMTNAAVVEMMEVKLSTSPDELELGDSAVAFIRAGSVPFFEMPPDHLPLDALASARRQRDVSLGAKLRCGGTSADLFPSPQRVADFIGGCMERSLPFKCTAGLHHPVRHHDPRTGFTHHGFLNILAASSAAAGGVPNLTEIISDTDPESFTVGRSGLSWRDIQFSADSVRAVRRGGFVGYGSCDFDEPVGDLANLGMLP